MLAERIAIGDGVTLCYIHTEKFKTNHMSINFIDELSEERASENALIPAVLMRGSETYPSMALLNRRLDYLYDGGVGSRVYKKGERQIMAFQFSFLDDSFVEETSLLFDGMFEMAEEILFHPLVKDGAFDADFTESEKQNQIDAIRSKRNNKNSYAVLRCREAMCEGEAYAVSELGSEEKIRRCDGALLYQRYREMIDTCPAVIFYIGHADKQSVCDKLSAMFGGKRSVKAIPDSVYKDAPSQVKTVEETMAVGQGKLTLGFRAPTLMGSDNAAAYSVFCDIFGNTPNGKLFMNVREKLSLCYYCSLLSEMNKGILFITCGINFADKDKAKDEILRQLEAIRRGEISEEEMEATRQALKSGYKELEDSPASLENWYFNRILAGLDTTPEQSLEKLLAVDVNQVVEEAKKIALDTVYFLKGEEA